MDHGVLIQRSLVNVRSLSILHTLPWILPPFNQGPIERRETLTFLQAFMVMSQAAWISRYRARNSEETRQSSLGLSGASGSSGGGRPVPLGGSGAGGRNTATAYGFGGGPPSTIPAGQPFSGRSQGGGTRNDVYGTK